jgi:Uma2 family endonuclease
MAAPVVHPAGRRLTSPVNERSARALSLSDGDQRLLLHDISWDAYIQIGEALRDRHVFITYDHGEMELRLVGVEHEFRKKRVGRLINTLTEELEIDIAGYGSMTFQRVDLQRGLEADECYWIKHETLVRDRLKIDPEVDPPPDLAVEIEISRSSMDRMGIHAALRVPELWRWVGGTLRVFLLTRKGTYKESKRSKAFPFLPWNEFTKFLTKTGISETQLVRSFRAWVRQQMAHGWK